MSVSELFSTSYQTLNKSHRMTLWERVIWNGVLVMVTVNSNSCRHRDGVRDVYPAETPKADCTAETQLPSLLVPGPLPPPPPPFLPFDSTGD